ncbi:MAG: hypothetical protein GX303_02970, partial [Clostridiales bacterium]|nr:hypothetical protein [Clostridiales bacterium]
GCSDGTTVIVEDLFANVPARRKFLKRDAAETMAAGAAIEKIALSHPEIAFKFIVDGNIKFSTVGDGNLYNTIYALLGREFAGRLIEVEGESDGIKVSGYVGRSDNVRANRNYQNFFVNGRYVKSRTAMAAIEQAYHSYIAPEKFPVCVLFIDINPAAVDVNVHPAKLEVKFSNEKAVFGAIYYAAKSALDANDKKPELTLKNLSRLDTEKAKSPAGTARRGVSAINAFLPIEERGEARSEQIRIPPTSLTFSSAMPPDVIRTSPSAFGYRIEKQSPIPDNTPPRKGGNFVEKVSENGGDFHQVKDAQPVPQEKPLKASEDFSSSAAEGSTDTAAAPQKEYRIIGEVFNCYILVETEDRLLIIDKHAAHERIIFEKLSAAMTGADHAPQFLLLPIRVPLTGEELATAEEFREEIVATGFDYTIELEKKVVFINRLPDMILPADASDVFTTIVDRLSKGTGNANITRDILYEQALYQAACKAALKAGRTDAPEHIAWLCDMLMRLPDITVCPHGRPVLTEMTKNYLDRQFSRG